MHVLILQGQTLADRLLASPIAIGEALPIARQIAEALEAAHDKGVIHRDLKEATNQPPSAPNGAWLAYVEGRLSQLGEIDIRPFPDVARTRVPVARGSQIEVVLNWFEELKARVPVD